MLLRWAALLWCSWTELGAQNPTLTLVPFECSSLLSASENLYWRGAYHQAEESQRRALKCQEKSLSARHPDLAASYDRLAELLRLRRRFRDAESLLKKAVAIWS